MDTNEEEFQIKVVFSSLCQVMLKGLRHKDAFLHIIFLIIALISIITSVFLFNFVQKTYK